MPEAWKNTERVTRMMNHVLGNAVMDNMPTSHYDNESVSFLHEVCKHVGIRVRSVRRDEIELFSGNKAFDVQNNGNLSERSAFTDGLTREWVVQGVKFKSTHALLVWILDMTTYPTRSPRTTDELLGILLQT